MPSIKADLEVYQRAVIQSASYANVLRILKKEGVIHRQTTLISILNMLNIDVSHFTGQGWKKDDFSENPTTKNAWKLKLIRDRGHQCEKCQRSEWQGILIALEVEHIDSDKHNNIVGNFLLLCPNCHSQTSTWRRKKSSLSHDNTKSTICDNCGNSKDYTSKQCRQCYENSRNKPLPKPPAAKKLVP